MARPGFVDPGLRAAQAGAVMNLRWSRLARYAAVGILTLGIYLVMGEWVQRSGMHFGWQATLPFAAAVICNYLLQRSWVFQDARPVSSSLPRYTVMIVTGWTLNTLTLFALAPVVSLLLAQLLAALLVVLSNAVFSFAWVFIDRAGKSSPSSDIIC